MNRRGFFTHGLAGMVGAAMGTVNTDEAEAKPPQQYPTAAEIADAVWNADCRSSMLTIGNIRMTGEGTDDPTVLIEDPRPSVGGSIDLNGSR